MVMLWSDTVRNHKEALHSNFFKALHKNFEINWLSGFTEQRVWLSEKEHKKHELIAPDGITQCGEEAYRGLKRTSCSLYLVIN